MNALIKLLRVTHCRSTHHLFALDALPLMQTDAGSRLARILLRHHERYLAGAIDPDERFRDYQNHVIHANEGYWGGAPRVAQAWYERLQRYLRTDRLSDAAHAAGVLSHYFTDIMQPLHTEICAREKVLHQPIERSVYETYESIYRGWQEDEMRIVFQLADRPEWLGEAMLHAARFAHRKRETLLDGYSIEGFSHPPHHGLNVHCRAALAELFGLAITGTARLLERAADESEAKCHQPLPRVSLAPSFSWAMVAAPIRWPAKWLSDRGQRSETIALIDEYGRTGSLHEHLPTDVDIAHRVVQVYHDEKYWKKRRQQRLKSKLTVVRVDSDGEDQDLGTPVTVPPVAVDARQRKWLSGPLASAPSIGPKTAARLSAIDIDTIEQFLAMPAEVISQRLQAYWLTTETIRLWQGQARLKGQLEGLSDVHAQLLAGSGYTSAEAIAQCEPAKLQADVSRFALTTSGRRYLQGGKLPSAKRMARWIVDARSSWNDSQPLRRSA